MPPWDVHPGQADPGLPFRLDENLARYPLDWIGEKAAESAARYQLAWSEIAEQVVRAWSRDLEAEKEDARKGMELLCADPQLDSDQADWGQVLVSLQRLMSLHWWRHAMLEFPPLTPEKGEAPGGFFTRDQAERLQAEAIRGAQERREAADDLAIAAASFLRVLLRPWFEGNAEVDYQVVVTALRWGASGMITESVLDRLRAAGGPGPE